MPRRWHQVGGSRFRRRRWQTSPVTGESAKETVKTIAQGMPGDSGEPVVTNARVYYTPRAAAGASGARHSLRPLLSEGQKFGQTSGAWRRENAGICLPPMSGIELDYARASISPCGAPPAYTIRNIPDRDVRRTGFV